MARKWKEKGYFNREQPQHHITLESYFIGKYPMTIEEYRVFMTMGGYFPEKYWTKAGWLWREAIGKIEPEYWEDEFFSGDDRLPVVGVSWYEATAYCRWLSAETGELHRLPTESEASELRKLPTDNVEQLFVFITVRFKVKTESIGDNFFTHFCLPIQ